MTKPELVAALNALSETLGRKLSTEGNVADLEARLAEAQAEAELLADEHNDEPITRTISESEPAQKKELSTSSDSGDRRFIRVLHALDVFHYPAGCSAAVRSIVQPGEIIEVSAGDAGSCVAAGHAEEA
jgi:hypothetical protein